NTLGKSRTYITNILRLLKLNEKVMEYIYEGVLSSGHGKVLLGVKDQEEQLRFANIIVEDKLSVRDTEALIKAKKSKKTPTVKTENQDPFLLDVEETLMRSLGTKVKLQSGKKVGKIEIEYYDDEDLNRLIEI